MHQTTTVSAKRPARSAIGKSAIGKLADAIVERLNEVLEALGPQPQLRPIPVRVRSRNRR